MEEIVFNNWNSDIKEINIINIRNINSKPQNSASVSENIDCTMCYFQSTFFSHSTIIICITNN